MDSPPVPLADLPVIRPDGFVAAAVPITGSRADVRALTAAVRAQGLRTAVAG